MKIIGLFALSAAAAFAQPFGFGVKAGVPLNDFLDAASNQSFHFNATTNRYIIGPSVELRLPFGLGVGFDALYRHFGYTGFGTTPGSTNTVLSSTTTSGAWEFPLTLRYRLKGDFLLHPYVEAGVTWDKLSGLTQDVSIAASSIISKNSSSTPMELNTDFTRGFVMGVGVDVRVLFLHISPGIRYTRWGDQHFIDPLGLLHSSQNQGEFLVGFKF
jgi:hypothetical protein